MNHSILSKLVAHRGDNKRFPENSHKGIEAALKAGLQFIEFDIQMTKDQQFIVHHDADLKRMAKQDISVFSHDYDTLKAFSIHESTRFNTQHYPTPLSLLSDVLGLLRQYPQATFFVEIKMQSLKHWGRTTVMDDLITLLKPYASQCVIISFSALALAYAKKHSNLRTGWVVKHYDDVSQQKATTLDPNFLICDYKKVPKTHAPWKGDWQWMLYSINDPETVLYYSQLGIDLIETDNIPRLFNSTRLQGQKAA